MERLTIGRMAKLNHISEQTLRLYDKRGLLQPDTVNETTGYRYYSMRQCARLDMIQHMKSLGMRLEDIKRLLDEGSPTLMRSILQQKGAQIDEQIQELTIQRHAIERSLQDYERLQASPPDGTMVLEYTQRRYMYCIDAGLNFYDQDIGVYESMLRKLKESLLRDGLPPLYFYNAGSVLRRERLLQGELYSSEVFVFVDPEHVPPELICSIEPNMYLCIYCDRFDKETEYIARLLAEIKARNYIVCGDYLCEVLAEQSQNQTDERDMFLRLQVPIRFR